MDEGMIVVRRYVCPEQRRAIWVATDRTRWHVWWGPDGGPYEHQRPAGEPEVRALVAELRHRVGGVWQDVTHRTGG